jgi:hypothetical protein
LYVNRGLEWVESTKYVTGAANDVLHKPASASAMIQVNFMVDFREGTSCIGKGRSGTRDYR